MCEQQYRAPRLVLEKLTFPLIDRKTLILSYDAICKKMLYLIWIGMILKYILGCPHSRLNSTIWCPTAIFVEINLPLNLPIYPLRGIKWVESKNQPSSLKSGRKITLFWGVTLEKSKIFQFYIIIPLLRGKKGWNRKSDFTNEFGVKK